MGSNCDYFRGGTSIISCAQVPDLPNSCTGCG